MRQTPAVVRVGPGVAAPPTVLSHSDRAEIYCFVEELTGNNDAFEVAIEFTERVIPISSTREVALFVEFQAMSPLASYNFNSTGNCGITGQLMIDGSFADQYCKQLLNPTGWINDYRPHATLALSYPATTDVRVQPFLFADMNSAVPTLAVQVFIMAIVGERS